MALLSLPARARGIQLTCAGGARRLELVPWRIFLRPIGELGEGFDSRIRRSVHAYLARLHLEEDFEAVERWAAALARAELGGPVCVLSFEAKGVIGLDTETEV